MPDSRTKECENASHKTYPAIVTGASSGRHIDGRMDKSKEAYRFPNGVNILPWMLCSTKEIGEATAEKMKAARWYNNSTR